MLGDDLAGGIGATTAAAPHGKLALNFEQRARTMVHRLTDLAVTHCVADAHVHSEPSWITAAGAAF